MTMTKDLKLRILDEIIVSLEDKGKSCCGYGLCNLLHTQIIFSTPYRGSISIRDTFPAFTYKNAVIHGRANPLNRVFKSWGKCGYWWDNRENKYNYKSRIKFLKWLKTTI